MKLLFICTHNRCRSILAEAICWHVNLQGSGLIQAYSAGSEPEGVVHPKSIEYLNLRGIDTRDLKSEGWEDFDAFTFDVVITVCDNAAGEVCPLYLSQAAKVHWGLPDPSKLSDEQQGLAFNRVIDVLIQRLSLFDKKLVAMSQKYVEEQSTDWPQVLRDIAVAIPCEPFKL